MCLGVLIVGESTNRGGGGGGDTKREDPNQK